MTPMIARSRGEVGRCGVAVDSVADMEVLFRGIPLDEVSVSMTINGPAIVLFAMYLVVAERQGVKFRDLQGTPAKRHLERVYRAKGMDLPAGALAQDDQ